MVRAMTDEELVSHIKALVGRVLDYGVPQDVTIDGANNICINRVPIGDIRKAHDFSVTEEGFLKFGYGKSCKRVVNFGYRGYERRNRVKEVIEIGREMPSRVVWSEDKERISV